MDLSLYPKEKIGFSEIDKDSYSIRQAWQDEAFRELSFEKSNNRIWWSKVYEKSLEADFWCNRM